MNKYLPIFIVIFLSFNSSATALINSKEATKQRNCFSQIFTEHETWRNFIENKLNKKFKSEDKLKKAMSRFDKRFTKNAFDKYKRNLLCSIFEYQVDGIGVNGYVIKPKEHKGKLPVLIYNRGGNGRYGSVVFGSMMNNLFSIAEEGFVIIGSQYRQSRKKGLLLDEFGGKDVKDVTELLKYIPKIDGANPERIGMFGASRGGMQTFLAAKQLKNIKAIATIAGNSDLLKDLHFRPEMEKVYSRRIPNYDSNKVVELERRSVLRWTNELSLNTPILLLHGRNDKRVSVQRSIELADALAQKNIPHKLVVYANDNHGLMKNKAKVDNELVTWFRKYL